MPAIPRLIVGANSGHLGLRSIGGMSFEHANKIDDNAKFGRAVNAGGHKHDQGRRSSSNSDSISSGSPYLRKSPDLDVESANPFVQMPSFGRTRLGSVGADPGERGMLDDFEAEARQTDTPRGRRSTRAGKRAPTPTAEQEDAYRKKQFAENHYQHAGAQVSSEVAGNWPMYLWQSVNAKPVTRLPGKARKKDPDNQAFMMQNIADALSRFKGGESVYASEAESVQALTEKNAPASLGNGDDRGMVDEFDAEFDSGAPLDDTNIELPAYAPASASRRDSDYQVKKIKGKRMFMEIPTTQPKTNAEERAEQARVYANTPYEDELGRPLKNSDPRTRGLGEAPLPKKKSAMSRWWSGSRLNWNNWDWVKKRRARRAGV
jgi:hypothetical protein